VLYPEQEIMKTYFLLNWASRREGACGSGGLSPRIPNSQH